MTFESHRGRRTAANPGNPGLLRLAHSRIGLTARQSLSHLVFKFACNLAAPLPGQAGPGPGSAGPGAPARLEQSMIMNPGPRAAAAAGAVAFRVPVSAGPSDPPAHAGPGSGRRRRPACPARVRPGRPSHCGR